MHLITMAHLGEAQGVIDTFQLKRTSPRLYEGENLSCLITGEGPFEAAISVAHELAGGKYKIVINLGIAGSLESSIEVGEIHPVRSIYLIMDLKPQFKSFKSFDSGLDCLTSFERILDPEKSHFLQGVGSLVDREAWGVAMAAKDAGIEFKAYKLISDLAGSLGACELVKDQAQGFSQKLADFLATEINTNSIKKASDFELAGFYFTFSTEHQIKQMLQKLALREERTVEDILADFPLDQLREEKILPKERTKKLLSLVEFRLDPLKEKLESGLSQWKRPFEQKGIQLQTDNTWEKAEVKIIFECKNDEELKRKIQTLETLSFDSFIKLRNGEIHVE